MESGRTTGQTEDTPPDDRATVGDDVETVQVLEFDLGPEQYCVDIGYVAEIVDMGDLTTVPNAPSHIEGVMDLRGRTTSIVDPTTVLGIDSDGDGQRIVVFDPDETGEEGAIGWIVDEVEQVSRIVPADTEDPPGDSDAIEGIVQRETGFVMWINPEKVNT